MYHTRSYGKTFRLILTLGLGIASLYVWAITYNQHQIHLNLVALDLVHKQAIQEQAQETSKPAPLSDLQNPPSAEASAQTIANPSPEQMPVGLYPAFVQAQQNDTSGSYVIAESDRGWQASNLAQNFQAHFSSEGIAFEGWEMNLKGLGWEGQHLTSLTPVSPKVQGQRVEYQRSEGVSEWYINGPMGLEQGFTLDYNLAEQPQQDSWLALELSLQGANAISTRSGDWLEIKPDNGPSLRYGKLYVYDADGQVLPSKLEVQPGGNGLRLLTDVSKAHFPVTIDPLFQQQMLVASDGSANDYFGVSVVLNATGDTAFVSAYNKNIGFRFYQGVVYVFSRGVGSVWNQQQVLSTTIGSGENFGYSIALNAAGDTLLIGAPTKSTGYPQEGATYVFTKSGNNFIQQQILSDTITGATFDHFGAVIAINAAGDTALISAYDKAIGGNNQQGTVYVFGRSGGIFTQQQILTDTAGTAGDLFGGSLALNAAGDIAFVGAPFKDATNIDQGSVFVFSRNAGVFTQQQVLSDTNTGTTDDTFGYSVALNSVGDIALIGAANKVLNGYLGQGVAYVFTKNSGIFTQQQVLSDSIAGPSYKLFGTSIALNAAGDTAFIGAPSITMGGTNQQGKIIIFNLNNAVFIQAQVLSDTVTGAAGDNFGFSIALDATGDIVLTGAPSKNFGGNSKQGAAYIFSSCNPLVVSYINDDGVGSTCGTFSYALTHASGVTITFALTQGNTITFTGPLTPVVKTGVTIDGGSGAGIVLNGNGVAGNGLQLQGLDTLRKLTMCHFGGRGILISGRGNKFIQVVVRRI